MSAAKTLQKMRRNPVDWRIADLQSVAKEYRIECRKPGHGGSHVIFSAEGVQRIVSIPAKRPIKPVYIKQFLELVDSSTEVERSDAD